MSSLRRRAGVYVFVAALAPVAVAVGISTLSEDTQRDAEAVGRLLQATIDREAMQRHIAITHACRDDLYIDQMLLQGGTSVAENRSLRALQRSQSMDYLWVLSAGESNFGEVLARGHRSHVLRDGGTLLRALEQSHEAQFLYALGPAEEQQLWLTGCRVTRAAASVAVVGGIRIGRLRELAPSLIQLRTNLNSLDLPIMNLKTATGETALALVLARSNQDGPLLWAYGLALVVTALLAALLVSGAVARELQRALQELENAADRIGAGDLETSVVGEARDEFRTTATAFNRMIADLRDAREKLQQSERVSAWQEIAKRLAHELKNPLSPIRMSIETVQRAYERNHPDFDTILTDTTQTIVEEVERLRHIIDEFSRFAQLPEPQRTAIDARQVIDRVTILHADTGGASLHWDRPGVPREIFADAEQLVQVLVNLVRNALDAVHTRYPDGGGTVAITLDQDQSDVVIKVADDGKGISASEAERIFEPYFTTKKDGTGLGLAISRRIVIEHGGRIDASPNERGGTTLRIVLPALARSQDAFAQTLWQNPKL